MTDTPRTPGTRASDPSESPPADDCPWDAADQLEADLESVEYAAYLMMSDAINTVRQLPGLSERGVDIEDPVFGPDRVMLRLSPYDYLDNHLPNADVLLTAIQGSGPGDGVEAGSERWLYSHSGKPVSVAAAALCLAVPRDSLKQAIEVLRPGMRAALKSWQERSPQMLAEANRHAGDPRSAGGRMDALLKRICRSAYQPTQDGAQR
jgi:hypothetical protein